MSRQAAAQSAKKDQKAAIADKNAEKDRMAAMGVTPAWAKAMKGDVLLCTQCGATQMGPIIKCECVGGKKKPGSDYEELPQLLEAAKARHAAGSAAQREENTKHQGAVQKERQKNKEANENEKNDLEAEFQGDGVDMMVLVEFPVGKLGMDVEKNAVVKIGDAPSNAADGKVKVGWIIAKVNEKMIPPNENAEKHKKAIIQAIGAAMKVGPAKIGFRVPITDGFLCCAACDKFMECDQFDQEEIDTGPGKYRCGTCVEIADMGDFD